MKQSAVQKAMSLLLHQSRTEKELRNRLAMSGFEQEEVEEAVAYVSSFGYLNDRRYAENYVLSYSGKKSRRAIREGLLEKGVSEEEADAALAELQTDEQGLILSLLRKKAGDPHLLQEGELRRVLSFLGRRGFSSGDVWKAIRKYQDSAPEDARE
ncbi:MAG: regulatory protein RecX [Eubacterium sp.]|nr:regulatory protein RecX [Eubacterium sp.]